MTRNFWFFECLSQEILNLSNSGYWRQKQRVGSNFGESRWKIGISVPRSSIIEKSGEKGIKEPVGQNPKICMRMNIVSRKKTSYIYAIKLKNCKVIPGNWHSIVSPHGSKYLPKSFLQTTRKRTQSKKVGSNRIIRVYSRAWAKTFHIKRTCTFC